VSERQMLELAAKAAGYEWRRDIAEYRNERGIVGLWIINLSTGWNPLDMSSDALRLAVKLGISIRFCRETDSVICSKDEFEAVEGMDEHGVRRAITRVAVAIAIAQGGAA
jgi:hypothetical protein